MASFIVTSDNDVIHSHISQDSWHWETFFDVSFDFDAYLADTDM